MKFATLLTAIALVCSLCAQEPLPNIADKTKGLVKKTGLLNFYVDGPNEKVLLELPPPDVKGEVGSFLYVEGLTNGLGSNIIGLDRGQIGGTDLVVLKRIGGKLLIEIPNLRYRAVDGSAAEKQAVRQSFAPSIIWAGKVIAQDADGTSLVDFTSFLIRDAHQVQASTRTHGAFSLDKERSTFRAEDCLAFPENLEFEVLLTYQSASPSGEVARTVPDASSLMLIQHHSLVKLPPDGFRTRAFDPRSSSFPLTYFDYSTPLSEALEKKIISRHRLEKVDPTAAKSKVKKSIVYYVDHAVPAPIRDALLEGAGWWQEAFEAAGFLDAFRVEVLPEGVHPLDVRYNVIQGVHRSTRGWSYGNSVVDPRTGEILKGHVSLESLRARQDRLIFEGLLGTANTGKGTPNDPIELSLARIRQLSAHELGHTLGFAHNFAGSTYGNRASVMDYPAPLVKLRPDGSFDTSEAYAKGIGAWDKYTVEYAYAEPAPGENEKSFLNSIVQKGIAQKLAFLSDGDARSESGSNPLGVLWDNGRDPLVTLKEVSAVRRVALAKFGADNLPKGLPISLLEQVLVPVYLHHRYQLDATIRMVGGLKYVFALRGDGQTPTTPIEPSRQREALSSLLLALKAEDLDIPEKVAALVGPTPFGYGDSPEHFVRTTGPAFDTLSAASSLADLVIRGILNPERCARVVELNRRDPKQPPLDEVVAKLITALFQRSEPANTRLGEIERAVQWVAIKRLMDLGADAAVSGNVRSRVVAALETIRTGAFFPVVPSLAQNAHQRLVVAEIKRFLERPYGSGVTLTLPAIAPPGSPIGCSQGG